MYKYLITMMISLAVITNVSAQTSKPHFDLKNTVSAEESARYYNALKEFNFESYRFYSQRRAIRFTNSPVIIELYSAKELLDLYQKPVSELTLMDNKPKKEIEFYYFPEGKIKVNEKN